MGTCLPLAKRKEIATRPMTHEPSHSSGSTSPLTASFLYVKKENIQAHYILKNIVGSGYFGHVRIATRPDGVASEKYAVKSIAKAKVTNKSLLRRELENLHEVDHPNIIQVYELYEDQHYIHVVMELCTGGELYHRMLQQTHFPEAEAATLVYKLLHAVNYLHNKKICHRDIKPENILFSSDAVNNEIKLIDFGLANKFAEDSELKSIVGTPYYIAPEVLHKTYGPECDVWSIGVLMYYMLSGKLPFNGNSYKEVHYAILTQECDFEGAEWTQISAEAKELVSKLLCKSRLDRLTAAQAMEHPWFAHNMQQPSIKHKKKILRRLTRVHTECALRTDILGLVSRHLSEEEIKNLNHVFRTIDTEHVGYIGVKQLQEVLGKFDSAAFEEAFAPLSRHEQNKIQYSEFLTAAMDRRILYNHEVRWMAFKFFDVDDNGYITIDSMKKALESLEVKASDEEVMFMIEEAGLKYDNKIDFEEFCKLLEPLPDELSSASGSLVDSESAVHRGSFDLT